MERKPKVTQQAVDAACEELQQAGKNASVNAVIAIAGGSFSTVGPMVKAWRAEQQKKAAPAIEMPESITNAMYQATAVVWEAAASLANERIERARTEAQDALAQSRSELSEYMGAIASLEQQLDKTQKSLTSAEKRLSMTASEIAQLNTHKVSLETRLADRDSELKQLREDYKKLQADLVAIAKTGKDKH
ncbi:MAG: DNA-binding protein [Burkholderiales bacterium]|jgi:chromosome segregation ATPase|nr:DNA-binding protein [Burkholderiales bacterium]